MAVVLLLLPLELLAARVTAQGGGADYSKLLILAHQVLPWMDYSKLLQNAFWLTKYYLDSTTPARHACFAAA